jgi:pimeloyl-ACP methyl ester carboxylesterase
MQFWEKKVKKFVRFLTVRLTVLLTFFLSGCYQLPKIPIETIQYDAQTAQVPRTLIVFLPGNNDSITVFQKKGLIDAVRERGLPIDMIAVNAHIGYYMNWTILTRLNEDVIRPAKSRSYNQIWLVGDSLGALGSISYAKEHPNDITGVVLLGPFLGDEKLINEIRQQGGLYSWDPGDTKSATKEALERSIWAWIKECYAKKGCTFLMYLGYGRDDRFTYAQDFLASFMQPEHVITIDGGHDWRTWKKIWLMLLNKNVFQVKNGT